MSSHRLTLTNLSSLRNGVLHDARHVCDGQIDVLLSVVLLGAPLLVVVHALLSVLCRTQTPAEQSGRREAPRNVRFLTYHPGVGGRTAQRPCTPQ